MILWLCLWLTAVAVLAFGVGVYMLQIYEGLAKSGLRLDKPAADDNEIYHEEPTGEWPDDAEDN